MFIFNKRLNKNSLFISNLDYRLRALLSGINFITIQKPKIFRQPAPSPVGEGWGEGLLELE